VLYRLSYDLEAQDAILFPLLPRANPAAIGISRSDQRDTHFLLNDAKSSQSVRRM